MSAPEHENLPKVKVLNTPDEYILWQRRAFELIRRSDPEMLCFTDLPDGATSAAKKKWIEKSMRAKYTIVLLLGDSALTQV